MSTLATTALTVAKMLGRADAAGTAIIDLETEIKDEIKNTIRHYNRRPLHLLEVRGGILTTVAGQTWYNSVTVDTAIREGGDFDIDDAVTSLPVDEIMNVHYMREAPGGSGLNEPMTEVPYRQFERFFEGSTPQGQPEYFTCYAGQIGIWPTPSGVQTLYWSGVVKPVVPATDAAQSIWFEKANELIESGAATRVAAKWLRDPELAAIHGAAETAAYNALQAEYAQRSGRGRITAHD